MVPADTVMPRPRAMVPGDGEHEEAVFGGQKPRQAVAAGDERMDSGAGADDEENPGEGFHGS